MIKSTDFLAFRNKIRRANVNLVITGWYGQKWVATKCKSYGTLKSGAYHI